MSRAEVADRRPTLIFVHIPKTAGSTLRRVVRREYGDRLYEVYGEPPAARVEAFGAMPLEERARVRAIMGHLPYGMHELVPGPSVYATLLRDPVARVLSTYHYVRRKVSHPQHELVVGEGLSLREVVETGAIPLMDNGQVRVLSGMRAPPGGCTPEMLDQAQRHLSERFDVVGCVERFDLTLALLRDRLGWGGGRYRSRNVRPAGEPAARITGEDLAAVREHNALDRELYEASRARFEETVRRRGARFACRVGVASRLHRVSVAGGTLRRRLRTAGQRLIP